MALGGSECLSALGLLPLPGKHILMTTAPNPLLKRPGSLPILGMVKHTFYPSVGWQRQAELCEIEVYWVPGQPKATQEDPVSKRKKEEKDAMEEEEEVEGGRKRRGRRMLMRRRGRRKKRKRKQQPSSCTNSFPHYRACLPLVSFTVLTQGIVAMHTCDRRIRSSCASSSVEDRATDSESPFLCHF